MLLIVTERFDPHVDFVEPLLNERAIPWRRLHLGDFPTRMSAGCEINNGNVGGSLQVNSQPLALKDIHAVWYRRTERTRLPADLDEGGRLLVEREARAFIQGLWRLLDRAFWIANPDAIRQASSKAEQLVRAAKFGFRVPPTCVSNDPEYIRAFLDRLGAETEVIYRPHTPIMVDRPEGKTGVVYTTRLGREGRERLDEIRLTPGSFRHTYQSRSNSALRLSTTRSLPAQSILSWSPRPGPIGARIDGAMRRRIHDMSRSTCRRTLQMRAATSCLATG
jgi:hypothetical protein